jgi:hypothetical protein
MPIIKNGGTSFRLDIGQPHAGWILVRIERNFHNTTIGTHTFVFERNGEHRHISNEKWEGERSHCTNGKWKTHPVPTQLAIFALRDTKVLEDESAAERHGQEIGS